jgi:hypothetical protein
MERSTLQRIEYGETALSVDKLWALADTLGVPVTWLLTDDWHTPGWRAGGGENPGAGGGETPGTPRSNGPG